jgi:protein KRI1
MISFSFFIILESTEDEDAEELTEDVEKDFFRTLSMLKSKDPRIYDGKTTFFATTSKDDNGDVDGVGKKKEKKEKPLTLGDLERKVMLEKGGHYEEMDEFKQTPRLDFGF